MPYVRQKNKSEYKDSPRMAEYRDTLVSRRSEAIADDGFNDINVKQPDAFKPKRVKVFNYSDEVKEVIEIDYTGHSNNGGRKGKKATEVSEEDKKRNLQRVKRNVRRLALANDLGQVHLMLSFKENMQDLAYADECFRVFMKDLHLLYPYLKYIATREYQERGAIHYHVLLNQRVDYKKVLKIWGQGWISLVHHDTKLKAVLYVLKYIAKEVGQTTMTTQKGYSKKSYLSSKGLKKEVTGCCTSFLITNSKDYVEYNDGLNFMMTNLTEGWDMPINMQLPDGRKLSGRSVLRCVANNY